MNHGVNDARATHESLFNAASVILMSERYAWEMLPLQKQAHSFRAQKPLVMHAAASPEQLPKHVALSQACGYCRWQA